MNLHRFTVLLAASLLLAACEKKAPSTNLEQIPPAEPAASEESEELSAPEKAALQASRPFLHAIASGDYATAYALLSSRAKARMSVNQFKPPEDDAVAAANEAKAVANPSVQDFRNFMATVEKEYGKPAKITSSDVISTDPVVLSGKGDAMETAFTIGLMPESIPVDIRKASVRSQISVSLTPERLKEVAEAEGMTVEELQRNDDFAPYCNLNIVLVEEGGELTVGYFEFTPPSMWD